jgi:hypothetical protein
MRSNHYFFILILIFIFQLQFNYCKAQADSLSKDSLVIKKPEKKWKFDSQLDQRNSFYQVNNSSTSLPIIGYNIGWVRKEKFRFGIGGYYAKTHDSKAYFVKYSSIIQNNAPTAVILYGQSGNYYLIQQNIKMYYFTPSVEWIFFTSKWLDLSIPVEVGIGYSKLTLTDYFSGAEIPIFSYKSGNILQGDAIFFPAMSGLSAMLKLSPDVGFQTGVGYRTILQEVGISQNFDSWYYMVGLQLLPGNIKNNLIKDIKKLKEKRLKRKAIRRQRPEKNSN